MADSRRQENLAVKTKVWQQPYVNVFKWLGVDKGMEEADTHRFALIHGEVKQHIDKEAGRRVFRIAGSVPAANYMQIPHSINQSLGLTGRYLYIGLKPSEKVYVLHIDLYTQHGHTVRVSFSSLYKSVKTGSRMIRFPGQFKPDRWTLFCIDCVDILAHIDGQPVYSYIKGIQLCANMSVRSMFTTDTRFTQKTLPRDFWPVPQRAKAKPKSVTVAGGIGNGKDGQIDATDTDVNFDWFWAPEDIVLGQKEGSGTKMSVNLGSGTKKLKSKMRTKGKGKKGTAAEMESKDGGEGGGKAQIGGNGRPSEADRKRAIAANSTARALSGSIAAQRTRTKHQGVEVLKHHHHHHQSQHQNDLETLVLSPRRPVAKPSTPVKAGQPTEPDSIAALKRAIGFSGHPNAGALWLDKRHVIYPSGTVVVLMSLDTGYQRVLFGHTEPISGMALSSTGRYLATAQSGKDSLIRIWDFGDWKHGAIPTDDQEEKMDPVVATSPSQVAVECVAILTGAISELSAVAWSHDAANTDSLIAAVGRDHRGRFAIGVWNTLPLEYGSRPKLISIRSHDYDTRAIAFSESREKVIVTCGHNNIRMWRIRGGDLRAASLELGTHQNHDFTAIAFQPFPGTHLLVATADGKVFQIDYKGRSLRYIYQLHDSSIITLAATQEFCVTGAEDGLLRLWRPDFSHSFLEVPHDGPVCSANVLTRSDNGNENENEDQDQEDEDYGENNTTNDGDRRVLVGSFPGAVGFLSIEGHTYQNIVRAHGGPILDLAVHPSLPEFATVSEDGTARIWSLETFAQLYEFAADGECVHSVCYRPSDSEHLLACGFGSGIVRVFDIDTTKCLHETPALHVGPVLALAYDRSGDRLFSVGADGRTVVMNVSDEYDSQLVRTMLAPQLPPDLVPPEVHDARTLTSSPMKKSTLKPALSSTMASVIEAGRLNQTHLHNNTNNSGGGSSGSGVCTKCLAGDAHVSICFNGDGSLMAISGAGSGHISILSSATLELITSINTGSNSVASAVFSGDVILATTDESVILHCDPFTGNVRRGPPGPSGVVEIPPMSLALDVCGAHAVTGGSDGLLRVHSAESIHSPAVEGHGQFFLGHGHETTSMKFIPGGLGVISTDRGGTILVWDFLGMQFGGASPIMEFDEDGALAVAEELVAAEEERGEDFVLVNVDVDVSEEGEDEENEEARPNVPQPIPFSEEEAQAREKEEEEEFNIEEIEEEEEENEKETELPSKPPKHPGVLAMAHLEIGRGHDSGRSASVRVERGSPVSTVDTGVIDEEEEEQHGDHREDIGITVDTDKEGDETTASGKRWISDLPAIHYVPRSAAPMADTRYAPSPNDAGLRLQYLLGYSGRSGHDNVIWHASTGLFVYSAAGSLVVEDLQTRWQQHLLGHTSDVSCLAVSNDASLIASASGTADTTQVAGKGFSSPSQSQIDRLAIINVWDAATGQCLHSLAGHSGGGVQAMAFSPDGKFLASVGTATDCTLAIWRVGEDSEGDNDNLKSTEGEGEGESEGKSQESNLVATAELPTPVHRVIWDPHSPRELVTIGRGEQAGDGRRNAVLFWLVEEDGNQLKFQEADRPRPTNPTPEASSISVNKGSESDVEVDEATLGQSLRSNPVDHTAVAFSSSADDRVMYVGDVNGRIGVWDTVENRFLIQWIAHSRPAGNRGYFASEIDVISLSADGRKMITAGVSGEVKLWSIDIQSHTGTLVNSVDLSQSQSNSTSAMYSEVENDYVPGVSAACFDDTCTDGVVGSYAGQIYFVSFDPSANGRLVRLAGAHAAGRPVLSLGCDSEGRLLGTGGSDGCLRLWTMPSALGDPSGMEVEGWYSEAGVFSTQSGAGCMTVAFHPTAHIALACFADGSLLVVNLTENRVVATLQLAEDRYTGSNSPNSNRNNNNNISGSKATPSPWRTEQAAITHCTFVSGDLVLAGTRAGLVFVIRAGVESGKFGDADETAADWSTPRVLSINDSHRGHQIDSLDVCRTDPHRVLACDGGGNITVWKVSENGNGLGLTTVYEDHLEFGSAPLREASSSMSALPCLVSFHPRDASVLLVSGFGPDPSHLLYYNYESRSVLRAVPLMHSLLCMSLSPSGYYLAMGTADRLVKLVDVDEGTFQDFIGHSDAVDAVWFAPSSRHLYSAGRDGAILCWNARA